MSDIIRKREYKDYDEYVAHQIEKTADPDRRARLLQKSRFDRKVDYFKRKFQRFLDAEVLNFGKTVCLGARMGEEIEAFLQLGVDCYGVDLVPHLPHVVKGDFQDLHFIRDGTIDTFYTNSMDHASDPGKVFLEVSRCLKEGGNFILDYFPGHWENHAASVITDPVQFFFNMKNSLVLLNAAYVSTMSNNAWELSFRKIENSIERERVERWARIKLEDFAFRVDKHKLAKIRAKQEKLS